MFWEYAKKKIKLNLFRVVFLVLESKGLFCLQRNGWEEPVPSFRVVKTTQKQAKRKYVSRYLWKTGGRSVYASVFCILEPWTS